MKYIQKIFSLVIIGVTFIPVIIFAQGSANNFSSFINTKIITGILNPLVLLFISLAVVYFIYGVFKFVRAESDDKKQEGREFMIWGIVGLFVMISVWGLVGILSTTLSLNNSRINVPSLSQ